MYEKLLQDLGLTKNETLVYLCLLKLGTAKSGEIVKEAKISGGKIYETLYKLVDKGIVKTIDMNGVKHFIASSPETLLNYINEKEQQVLTQKKELEAALPQLKQISAFNQQSENVALSKGFRGISSMVYESLEKGQNIKIMGVRSSKDIKFNNFWKRWHNHRVLLKKNAKIIFCDKGTEYWAFFKKMKYTEVKEVLSFSPSSIMIIDEQAFIFSYGEEEFTCISIQSKKIAESLSNMFDGLWMLPH